MGEIADAMVEGLFCEECGAWIDGEEPGYPRKCDNCKAEKFSNTFTGRFINNKVRVVAIPSKNRIKKITHE